MNKDWKKEFFKVYFNENSTIEEINNVLEIKNKNLPSNLYKYTNTKHIDDLLENNLFYLPEIEKLNDPFEGNVLYDLDLQIKRFIKYWFEKINPTSGKIDYSKIDLSQEFDKMKELIKENKIPIPLNKRVTNYELIKIKLLEESPTFYEMIKNMRENEVKEFFESLNELLRKDTKVACLTESLYNNPLWSFYGDNHKGICIKYNTEKFSKSLKDNSFPIFYDNSHFSDNMPIKDIEKLKEKYNLKAFLKKSEDWRCEKEWRIIITDNIRKKCNEYYTKDDNEYLKLEPEAVYLGKDLKNNKNEIINLCKKNNIEIYEMKQLKTQYKLKEYPVQ